jgi:predicted GNAT superfamily acetyltransferase
MSASLQIIEVESIDQAESMAAFFRSVWTDGDDVVPFDLILASVHVGGYAAIAKQDQEVVGASFGFLGEFAAHAVLHSHVTAASVPGVGFQLKQHQFAWAQEKDLGGITWTFDPLVRRNCVFNFEKLGAIAVEYLPNFYGTMTDTINAGDDSDRLFTYWPVQEKVSVESAKSSAVALQNIAGKPVFQAIDDSKAFWVELPEDIEQLRKTDIELARAWRKSVREAIQPSLETGWFISAVNAERTAILIEPSTSDYEFSEE